MFWLSILVSLSAGCCCHSDADDTAAVAVVAVVIKFCDDSSEDISKPAVRLPSPTPLSLLPRDESVAVNTR